MAFDMMNNSPSSVVSTMRSDFDLPTNAGNSFPYKGNPYSSFPPQSRTPQSNLTIAEQAELEYELRYRGNMIVDQQRKIQQLEDELRMARDQVEIMNSQLSTYEQDRSKEKKKPQSRYWTPEEHQRFLEALQKYGHKDVKSISMHVSTRNATQVRTHAQKYFLRLERERRKKEESHHDGYNSGSSLDDGLSGDHHSSDEGLSSVSISSLTLPGSPAVSMMSESVGTPPGTPGDGSASSTGPSSPATSGASPIIPPRRRATSFITVAQARLAAQHRDSVLVGLPPTWTVEDYDQFMKGLLTLADKHDDVSNLCRSIREQYLPHHTPEEVELCYRNVLKNLKQKPIVGSPKRRRTNSRPEPLTSPLMVSSFPASSLSLSSPFPFRPNSAPLSQSYSSSPPTQSSPLVQGSTQQQHLNNSHMRHANAFSEYGQMSSGLEQLPILSDLNMGGGMLSPNQHLHQQQTQQQQPQQSQHQHQQPQQSPLTSLSPLSQSALPSPLNTTVPITPSSLWGSALPFSFDALMSGSVGLSPPIPLVSHN